MYICLGLNITGKIVEQITKNVIIPFDPQLGQNFIKDPYDSDHFISYFNNYNLKGSITYIYNYIVLWP